MTTPASADKDPVLVRFGSEVREARERAGKRMTELASEVQVSSYHLGSIERGDVRASNALYWRIATALEIDPADVLRDQAAS